MFLTTSIVSPTAFLFPPVRVGQHCWNQNKNFFNTPKNVKFHPVAGFKPVLGLRLRTNAKKSSVSPVLGMKPASMTCFASLNATCAATQTQTVLDNPKTIDSVPTKEIKKPGDGNTPELDNTGGNPPTNGGGGGGGGGGGEGPFYGGFYLFMFLAFVTWLNEEAEKSGYVKNHRKRLVQQAQQYFE